MIREGSSMNTYDFDQTVFQPDSSFSFVMYCLRHYPRAVLHSVPGMSVVGLQRLMKKAETKELKEKIFSFLPRLDDVDRIVEEFWETHRDRLAPWYLAQKRSDDVIISASPDFLLRPICEELGVFLIATRMDPYTGKIHGLNCHDEEKVRRFRQEFPDGHTENFYSDSLADSPMAKIADRAFLVRDGKPGPWPD